MNDPLAVDVAIVGGGITGLAAAYELQQRGVDVAVLEASERPGGVILTERKGAWVVDGGPDAMLVHKPAAVALCRELGLGDRLIATLEPRTAYVMRNGRLHPLVEGSFLGFPVKLSALARSALFTVGGKLRMACEPFIPATEGDADESIASFVRRRFGEQAVDYLAEPLLAGIHAGDVDRLSMRALFPRLLDAERKSGSVLRSFRGSPQVPAPSGAFVSLPGGTGELVEALTGALRYGSVQLSSRITELHRAGTYLLKSNTLTVKATAVILSVPAYVAAGLIRGLDTTLAGLCEAVPYASTATVAFGYPRDRIGHPMNGTGFVVPRVERHPLLAGTWVTSKWPNRAPEGHTLLRAFLGGGRDPHRLDRDDSELVNTARDALTSLLHISGPPLFSRLFRWTRQSPQYEVGHLERMNVIDERVSSMPGLFIAGSGFRAIGIPDCIADGRNTGAQAAAFVAARRT